MDQLLLDDSCFHLPFVFRLLLDFGRTINGLGLQTVLPQPLVGGHVLVPVLLGLVHLCHTLTTGCGRVRACADMGNTATETALNIKVRVGFTMLQ